MKGFQGKIVFITGAASGIGHALATEVAHRGGVVLLADLDVERAARAAATICKDGGHAEALEVDVTDADAFRSAIDGAIGRHGRLDVLFNNAGIGMTGEARDTPPESWDRIIDVNLRGVIHGIHAAYPHMIRQGFGHISNTACVAGLVPFPMTSAYTATKYAVVGLSTALRGEAASLGVEVSVICPGLVDTDMFDHIEYFKVDRRAVQNPIAWLKIKPERCARHILAGVERNRAVITVNAHARLVWLLYRMAPRPFLAITSRLFGRVRRYLRIKPEI